MKTVLFLSLIKIKKIMTQTSERQYCHEDKIFVNKDGKLSVIAVNFISYRVRLRTMLAGATRCDSVERVSGTVRKQG